MKVSWKQSSASVAADRPAQHRHHVGGVLVDQDLERGQVSHLMD